MGNYLIPKPCDQICISKKKTENYCILQYYSTFTKLTYYYYFLLG